MVPDTEPVAPGTIAVGRAVSKAYPTDEIWHNFKDSHPLACRHYSTIVNDNKRNIRMNRSHVHHNFPTFVNMKIL